MRCISGEKGRAINANEIVTHKLPRTLCGVVVIRALLFFFFFQAEDGIRDLTVTGVQTCALPIWTSCRSCCRITAIRSATATSGCASSAPRPDRTALMRIRVCLGLALLLPLGPLARAQSPPAARVVPKIDTLHGEVREDDYFWLRDKKNPEVLAYLEAENAYTAAAMQHTEPLQEQLYREMLGRIKETDRKSTRLNSSHSQISYAVFCLKKKNT